VPVLSVFFGITVRVYFEDHAPPHIHVEYGEHRAIVEIETGSLLAGRLPDRCKRLVEEWRAVRIAELRSAWKAAQASKAPRRIPPLD
jgi:hypothetical protein